MPLNLDPSIHLIRAHVRFTSKRPQVDNPSQHFKLRVMVGSRFSMMATETANSARKGSSKTVEECHSTCQPTLLLASISFVVNKLLSMMQTESAVPSTILGMFTIVSSSIEESLLTLQSSCAQIAISSAGQNTAPPSISIPGHIDPNSPGVVFDYWNNKNPSNYQTPGPKVFSPPANYGRINQRVSINSLTCIAENANWCGKPLPSFQGEAECYSVSHISSGSYQWFIY